MNVNRIFCLIALAYACPSLSSTPSEKEQTNVFSREYIHAKGMTPKQKMTPERKDLCTALLQAWREQRNEIQKMHNKIQRLKSQNETLNKALRQKESSTSL